MSIKSVIADLQISYTSIEELNEKMQKALEETEKRLAKTETERKKLKIRLKALKKFLGKENNKSRGAQKDSGVGQEAGEKKEELQVT